MESAEKGHKRKRKREETGTAGRGKRDGAPRQGLKLRFKPTKAQHEQVMRLENEIGRAIENALDAKLIDEGDAWFYGNSDCDLTVARFLEQLHANWDTMDKDACQDFQAPKNYIIHLSNVLKTVKDKA